MTVRTQGSAVAPGFNGVGTINLHDYSSITPREQLNAGFLYYKFLDLDTVDENNPEMFNLAIRADQNTEDRIQSMQDEFNANGWCPDFPPPCVDVDGDRVVDGRGRIIAAKRNGEKYIPVAVYQYVDKSEKNYISNGLIANLHKPAERATMRDFVTAAVELCNNGELSPELTAITDWFYNDVGIMNFFTNLNGCITKGIQDVLTIYNNGNNEGLVRVQGRKGWESWCESNGYKLGKSRILVNADNETYVLRTFESILKACNKGNDPVEIILMTNSYSSKKARENVKGFEKNIENLYNMAHKMCYAVVRPDNKPWNVIGAIPQIKDSHDIESDKLVDVSKY